jgi:hypothetical protein
MKRILFFVVMMGIYFNGYGQDEFNNDFKAIPPKTEVPQKEIPAKEVPPTAKLPEFAVKKDTALINPDTLFTNPNYYKKETNTAGIYYRKNQYLGSIKTKSTTSKIRYRDAAFLDGDYIRIFLNHKVIVPEVALDSDYKEFKIKLKKGTNRIDIEALNEGAAPPNTAQFEIFDDKGVIVMTDQWNVGKGYKASIIIVKE